MLEQEVIYQEILIRDFILAHPDYYVPLLSIIRKNCPIRLVFLINDDDSIISIYKQLKQGYNGKTIRYHNEDIAQEKELCRYKDGKYVDYFDVKNLEIAKQVLDLISYHSDKITCLCEWTSLSQFSAFQIIYPDLERFVYWDNQNLLYLVDHIMPHSVNDYSGEFDHIFKGPYGGPEPYKKPIGTQYPLRNHFRGLYDSLRHMFEELSSNREAYFDSYYACHSLPVTSCKSISLEDLISFEDKLEELCLFNYRQSGSRGRDGEFYTDIRNFYSDLYHNRNFSITDEIHEYLKLKKAICFRIYDSNASYSDFDLERKKIYDLANAELKTQYGLDREDDIVPFICPPIRLPKELLSKYETRVSFPDNFRLSSEYTLKNIDEFVSVKKSSLLRPFIKQILDENFIKNLLLKLDRRGFSHEKWFVELANT
ncbi:hypothetical protein [Spirosoma fluviale]|uniref:Uncharacterized protein n=1 Tax=Spirosoma fluviale TaxID=1597977 RepID=A0A286FCI7_9BACT|nr:hypothetical protein [Spirosoma fluviale]SOD80951.1 hypothetical protein SAMN06269250_1622 [Spirosoma fluviale]